MRFSAPEFMDVKKWNRALPRVQTRLILISPGFSAVTWEQAENPGINLCAQSVKPTRFSDLMNPDKPQVNLHFTAD